MYKLIIGDNEYELPGDMSLETWIELSKWSPEPMFYPQIISVGMGIPINEVSSIPDDVKELAVALILGLTSPDWKGINYSYNGGELIKFDEMTLGQFIDLEVAVSNNLYKNVKQIISVLYNNVPVKPDTKLGEVWGAIKYYMQWRILLYSKYKNLFDIGSEDNEAVDNTQDNNVNNAHIWYNIVMVLADNKFLNIEPVVSRPLIEALNWLAWNKDRIKKENELQKHNRQARSTSK